MKRYVCLILVFCILIGSFNYKNYDDKKVHAAEVVIAESVLGELLTLIVGAISIGLTGFLLDEGFDITSMSQAEIKDLLKREFTFKYINHKLTVMSKSSGNTYVENNINWDVFNSTFDGLQNSLANQVIKYLEGDTTVSLDISMKSFLTWWTSRVRIKDGEYQVRVSEYVENQEISEWITKDLYEIELQYMPYVHRDSYLLLKNSLRDITGKFGARYANRTVPLSQKQTSNPIISDLLTRFINETIFNDSFEFNKFQFSVDPSVKMYIAVHYDTDDFIENDKYTKIFITISDVPLKFRNSSGITWMRRADGFNMDYEGYVRQRYVFLDHINTYPLIVSGIDQNKKGYGRLSMDDATSQVRCRENRVDPFIYSNYDLYYAPKYDAEYVLQDTLPIEDFTVPRVLTIAPTIALDDTGAITVGLDDVIDMPVVKDGEESAPYVPEIPSIKTYEEIYGEDSAPPIDTGFDWLDTLLDFLRGLLEQIINWLNSIWQAVVSIPSFLQGILDAVLSIKDKIPSIKNQQEKQIVFDDLKALLISKLGIFYQLKEFLESILNASYNNTRPSFTINLNGKYGVNDTMDIVDFDIYDQYRDYIQAIISAFAWFIFIKKMYRKIPNLLTT